MNRRLQMILGMAVGITLSLVGGCTPPGKNLVAAGTVSVDKQSMGSVRVSRVNVYQDGPTLVVDGSLNRSLSYRQRSMGHIDVAVLGPSGSVLAQTSFHDRWDDCAASTFSRTRLPVVAPEGSTVRVLFHNSQTAPAAGHTPEEWQSLWERPGKT